MPGLDGLKDMAELMKDLRENPPAEITGVKVVIRKDYTDGTVIDCVTGAKSRMELSGSNVLRYELEDGTVILVRPSGTEPKIKVYILTQGADAAACQRQSGKVRSVGGHSEALINYTNLIKPVPGNIVSGHFFAFSKVFSAIRRSFQIL